jgi:hypothetical protein
MGEWFRVVSGRLQTRIGAGEGMLGPGEEALAAAGTPHDWCNAGDTPASVIVELSPAAGLTRFEAMIATRTRRGARRRGLRRPCPELLKPQGGVQPDAGILAAAGLA